MDVQPAEKHAGGRPSEYTPDKANEICALLIEGKSLRSICRDEENMPAASTVFKWLSQQPEFAEQYARAKRESADALFEEMTDIVDDGTNDWMEDQYMKGKSPGWKVNGEAVQRSKLRWEDRRWKLSKLMPKKYGDKLDLTSNGEEMKALTITGMKIISDDLRTLPPTNKPDNAG